MRHKEKRETSHKAYSQSIHSRYVRGELLFIMSNLGNLFLPKLGVPIPFPLETVRPLVVVCPVDSPSYICTSENHQDKHSLKEETKPATTLLLRS